MVDEKDRLGNKLRDKEKGQEDEYFARRDRELVAKLRAQKDEDAQATFRQAVKMRCPKCGIDLDSRTQHGVNVEHCPKCDGIWLDRGELEALAGFESEGWISRWLRTK
jgi:hypothetical protein